MFTPKSLLRLSAAFSPLTDFGEGRQFEPILSSPGTGKATRLLLCNGKIAYDLERERTEQDAEDVRVVRLEMIYPLASERLAALFAEERRAEILWVQEEPENMGVWPWIRTHLKRIAREAGSEAQIRHCGRPECPSPAGSFHGNHDADQRAIVQAAFKARE